MIESLATPEMRMTSYLKKIATGPQKSVDLTLEEARDGMRLILERKVHAVQAGVFLVALRMKRETDDENKGLLEALREATLSVVTPIPELAEIADPYDGFKRHIPTSTFLPPLLAECGLPTISHGCYRVGPKYGITHRQILESACIVVNLSPKEAAHRLANPNMGWAYLDQANFSPALHDLIPLRRLIVKRPSLATLEKLCGPIRSEGANHLFIGYVHPGYEKQIPMAARHAGYRSCLTVRGIEGGVLLPMHRASEAMVYTHLGENRSITFDPKEAGIETTLRAVPTGTPNKQLTLVAVNAEESLSDCDALLAAASVRIGMEALSGVRGPAYDSLLLSAGAFLYAVGHFPSLCDAAKFVSKKLDSGAALKRFEQGMS
jgi:anthranilate phosphoribosyltransferase